LVGATDFTVAWGIRVVTKPGLSAAVFPVLKSLDRGATLLISDRLGDERRVVERPFLEGFPETEKRS
jgi:hypothetical protein